MPKVDEVKEFIGLLKIIFTFLLTIIFALTSWIFTSYNKADFLLVLSAIYWLNHCEHSKYFVINFYDKKDYRIREDEKR